MKPFSYAEMKQKMQIKTMKAVEENHEKNEFLQLYDENSTDHRVEQFCQKIKKDYHEKTINHRYYENFASEDLDKPEKRERLEKIKKMRNFQIGYKKVTEQQKKQIIQDNKNQELIRKLNIKRKFRYNVLLIMDKLRKLKMNVDDVIANNVFSKDPYKFGKDIFTAVKNGEEEKVWRILMENRLSVFSVDHTQKNALIWACMRGYHKIAEMLIESGCDINKEDINGFTPLYFAIKYDNPKCIRTLMLSLTWTGDQHDNQSSKANEKVRNIFNLGCRLMRTMKNIKMKKRMELLDEQYKYYYPDLPL